jgi:hypothetical protein|nr:MAG TPA: hypothetical protein [Bacteriophage sp.]
MTTEIINNLFGIKESFELPQALLAKLLDKVEKDKLCKEFVKQRVMAMFQEISFGGNVPVTRAQKFEEE